MASLPLDGTRIIEVSMFAPDGAGMHLADLGADVIKVEPPGLGDPARLVGKPYRGQSPASRRWNRGKRSIALDLRKADAVIEGMMRGLLSLPVTY